MKQTVNNSSFLWMVCVALVTIFFGYVLWLNPGYDVSNYPASGFFLLGTIAVGAFTFGIMCLSWFISLFRKHDSYKPFLGFKTSQNILMGIVSLIFMGVEFFGISTKTSEAYAKQLAQNPPQVVVYSPPPSASPLPKPKNTQVKQQVRDDGEPWGVAKQIDEHTWTMKIGEDAKMATPQEVFNALNDYRVTHGSNRLEWDDRLAVYGTTRAKYFTSIKALDGHKGFVEYTNNPDNLRTLGYWSVGENSSFGYRVSGVHLIEWVYAGDEPHNKNQLNPNWTRVGVGIDGESSDLIFAR